MKSDDDDTSTNHDGVDFGHIKRVRASKDGIATVPKDIADTCEVTCVLLAEIKILIIEAKVIDLYVDSCVSLERIEIKDTSNLRIVRLLNCAKLSVLPRSMPELRDVTINACDLVDALPESNALEVVTYVREAPGRISMQAEFSKNIRLFLDAFQIDKLNMANLDDFLPMADRVTELAVIASNVKTIENVFPNLTNATCASCPRLESFRAFSTKLKTLNINNCQNLINMPIFIRSSMTGMNISKCPKLVDNMPINLQNVQELKIDTTDIPIHNIDIENRFYYIALCIRPMQRASFIEKSSRVYVTLPVEILKYAISFLTSNRYKTLKQIRNDIVSGNERMSARIRNSLIEQRIDRPTDVDEATRPPTNRPSMIEDAM